MNQINRVKKLFKIKSLLLVSITRKSTFSLSALSILPENSLRSRSTLLKLDEYFGNVGGGIGLAAMAGFSCVLFTPCIPAVGVVEGVKFAIYAPGEDSTGLAGGTGGPCDGCDTGTLILVFFVYLK